MLLNLSLTHLSLIIFDVFSIYIVVYLLYTWKRILVNKDFHI